MLTIFRHTPAWVFALFAFLLYRGIRSLRPQTMTPVRMLFLPILFFVWAVLSVGKELNGSSIAYSAFAAGIALGGFAGWMIWRNRGTVTFDPATRMVCRPGSVWTLVLILIGFTAKFILSASLARNPSFSEVTSFKILFGGISGIVDGLFWGGTVAQLWRVKDKR